ncbi:uncharacterized protein LOC129759862 [Uranotaenia lowii]|uniref:uncharacterized protein LOC129759862 n=1 Tax=Uranotaenia lowii TaxID=190385 RepID=UPI002478D8BF|nr:uncharacterized protein LOC129759862 [Uranotaenia lowii]
MQSFQSNPESLRQVFQQPLQYGLPCYNRRASSGDEGGSGASTARWPSDETYKEIITESIPNKVEASHTGSTNTINLLPIRELQQLINLENAISNVFFCESLIEHLRLLTVHHGGNHSKMFRTFIPDEVLERVAFARIKEGKYEYTLRDNFSKIMSAMKVAWFVDKSEEQFESQMAHLVKKAHNRGKIIRTRNEQAVATCGSTTDDHEQDDVENQGNDNSDDESPSKVTVPQADAAASSQPPLLNTFATIHDPERQQLLLTQWYHSAMYYRDRYQVAKKANQKIKSDYSEQAKINKRRISRCLRRLQSMQQYLVVLENRLNDLD